VYSETNASSFMLERFSPAERRMPSHLPDFSGVVWALQRSNG
jgi:hypothetical protein